MSQSYNTIVLKTDDRGIATVIIDRPKKLNALNAEVLDELADVFNMIRNNGDIAAVIVTGAGEKAFVAGADITELRELDRLAATEISRKGQQLFQLIEDSRKPVIAAVNGYALGGGAELAMACHLRVAGGGAAFGFPEVGLGLIPGYGGTQRLPHIVGRARALEMILTGKQVKAEKAQEIGLVYTVAENDPVESARSMIREMLKNGPLAVQSAIQAVYCAGEKEGFDREAELFGKLCETDDFVEGTTAFLEKREPNFKGR